MLLTLPTKPLFSRFSSPRKLPLHTLIASPSCRARNGAPTPTPPRPLPSPPRRPSHNPNLPAAVGLIVGTAVGPGMLGLPSATINSGPLPSTVAITLAWIYVVSSILLVAELSFEAMEEGALEEVSFTALATDAFGVKFGSFVAIVYASLSFALVIACVSGVGSLAAQTFKFGNVVIANSVFPCLVGVVIACFPFGAIDAVNQMLCVMMIASITGLLGVGMSVGRIHLLDSFKIASWTVSDILPAIPVTVLTLGFHVITPFMCKIVGGSVEDARKAILIGGAIPLLMVLSWNLLILGLSRSSGVVAGDPISVLLSVNPSALPAVQGFAFTALATSLIGYCVSFPKQLVDTIDLASSILNWKRLQNSVAVGSPGLMVDRQVGRVGFVRYHFKGKTGSLGRTWFDISKSNLRSSYDEYVENTSGNGEQKSNSGISSCVMWVILFSAILVGTYLQAAFSRALDFAGVYANCFLFGILPPAMAWIHRSRNRSSDRLLPGGNIALIFLFAIAVVLMFWH